MSVNRPSKTSEICPHAAVCSGCSEWSTPLSNQIDRKKQIVIERLSTFLARKNIIETLDCFSVGNGHHRVWFDLQFSPQGLGLFNKDRQIVPIEHCSLMTPSLQKQFTSLQSLQFPSKKISARLRVSPENKYGLWLDMANVDVKELLIERTFLKSLDQLFQVIEIGQKRKKLITVVPEDQQFKLSDPELHPWFQTLGHQLFSAVGSFTQPSWVSADFITSSILRWSAGFKRITEYGSGIGQYTLPLLISKSYVTVYENNPLAVEALKINTRNFRDHLQLNPKNSAAADLYLVNPPRSGLMGFTKEIIKSDVNRVIYISCSIETLAHDLETLKEKYQVTDLKVVDQFPHSPHFETCVLLEKI